MSINPTPTLSYEITDIHQQKGGHITLTLGRVYWYAPDDPEEDAKSHPAEPGDDWAWGSPEPSETITLRLRNDEVDVAALKIGDDFTVTLTPFTRDPRA